MCMCLTSFNLQDYQIEGLAPADVYFIPSISKATLRCIDCQLKKTFDISVKRKQEYKVFIALKNLKAITAVV